tara:strand:- start:151 stop:567 length:417 start_codon:yes stop_codon:yes gene_type:complete
MKSTKLTSKILDRLILEVMQEMGLRESHKHIPHKNRYEADKHQRELQKGYEEKRTKEKELRPDYDLMKLSKGILEEDSFDPIEDEEGFVKIKKSALGRLLKEGGNLDSTCKKHGYHKIDDVIAFINRINAAEKGKLGK